MRLLYTGLFYLAVPLILLRLLWRARKAPAYRERWLERFGIFPAPGFDRPVIWIHAVSVGETIAAAPLVQQLLAKGDYQLAVTSMTPTGSEQVAKLFGDRVFHTYLPYDLPDCLARFFNRLQPRVCIIMETELWPNLVAGCAGRDIPVILANGRLSQKSAEGYRRIRWLIGPTFRQLTAAAIQHSDDAERMYALGLPRANGVVTGSIKFDLTIGESLRAHAAEVRAGFQAERERLVWIAASTHEGEDELIVTAFQQARDLYPELLLLLVPRHPERFDQVTALVRRQDLPVQRRGEGGPIAANTQVVIGDTMGELLLLFGVADLAFVGGSLVPVGGHNLIEPAAWGLPIITGESLFNFAEISRLLTEAEGLVTVSSSQTLAEAVAALAGDADKRRALGENARQVAEANRGALDRLLGVVEPYCENSER